MNTHSRTRPAAGAVLTAVLLGAAASTSLVAQRDSRTASDSAQVHAIVVGIVAADNAQDLERVLCFYAPDALLLPPGEPAVAAPEIRARYERLFAAFSPAIETTVDEVVVVGDLAYVRGRNGGRLVSRTGAADRTLGDVYLMILRRRSGGDWRISRLMWHARGTAVRN